VFVHPVDPYPWGSETPSRSRRESVILVDESAEQVPAADIARTDRHRVRQFASWGSQTDRHGEVAAGCSARHRSGASGQDAAGPR
jgi:hypothetical protein